jgi:putative chitinase
MIDRQRFYEAIRADRGIFPRGVAQSAVTTIDAMLDEWDRRELNDLRWLAYMLATIRGECGDAMAPVREGFTKTDAEARAFVRRQRYPYAAVVNGNVYYGRGLVQLTWERNYVVMGRLLGIDLHNNPDLALVPDIAVQILFEGMLRGESGKGDFTGKSLEDYFNGTREDWLNARRIINGTDKASTFAAWGKRFHAALVSAYESVAVSFSRPVTEPEALPPAKAYTEPREPMSKFRSTLGWVSGIATTVTTAFAGLGSYLSMVDWRVWVGFIIAAGFFGTIIFGLIWLFPRPIVIEKEKQ